MAAIIKHPKFSGFEACYNRHAAFVDVDIIKYRSIEGGKYRHVVDQVIVEDTFALVINEKYRINVQLTPAQLEQFSVGYLVCEGLITSFDQVRRVECRDDDKIWVWTDSAEDFFYWTEIRTSGCVGIKQQTEKLDITIDSDLKITPATIFKAQEELVRASNTWRVTGAAHMSALFNQKGKMLQYSEDVGRHNTIDKIIGAAVIEGADIADTFIVTSGRLSAAMVTKAARARVPIMISNSAPMIQGISIAEKTGMTLVAFSRKDVLNTYTRHERVLIE
ncbi:MAG: formate dehydrogenase accessory sulfurtransferase FdhD [Candidatus Sigynarchaeota archaeon]